MLLLCLLGCAAAPSPVVAPAATAEPPSAALSPPPPPSWPASALHPLPLVPVAGTLVLDAGHGAAGNPGNHNWAGEAEADVMRRVTDGVAAALGAAVAVTRTRPDALLVPYAARVRAANAATWFVSLHSDTRAGNDLTVDAAGHVTNTGATGFAVLYADEGAAPLVARRLALARALARRLTEVGFPPYDGGDYPGLYAADSVPGAFVDRHDDAKRIRVLRRPTSPSISVETHEAWDVAEARRWEEPDTWAAFASALDRALADAVAPPYPAGVK